MSCQRTQASSPSLFEMPGLGESPGVAELLDTAIPARGEHSPGQRVRASERRVLAGYSPPLQRPGGPRPMGRTRMVAP